MAMTRFLRMLDGVRAFLTGSGFPVFALTLLCSWEIFLATVLLMPTRAGGFGAFAEEFRVWCFGYDPATGRTEWAYVMAMMLPQLLMGTFIALFWWEPLRSALKRPRVFALQVAVAASLVVGASVGFAFSGGSAATGEMPFPAEALRTAYRAPDLALTNQLGEPVDLATLQGKVVVLTAVYASCGHTCPLLLTQAKAAVAELTPEEREDLRLLAVTLDPENDSQEVLGQLAQNFGLQAPLYQLLTGPPPEVESVLDRMQVARQRDPATGVIDHANLFLLIDRDGRLAYRLGLGERQQRWLVSALRVLLDERDAAG
jgi:protein SCO1/2